MGNGKMNRFGFEATRQEMGGAGTRAVLDNHKKGPACGDLVPGRKVRRKKHGALIGNGVTAGDTSKRASPCMRKMGLRP